MARSLAKVIAPAISQMRRPLVKNYHHRTGRVSGASKWQRIEAALTVWLEAKRGKEKELANFLRAALQRVQQEAFTASWYAVRLGPSRFVIFAAFAKEADRQEHLAGLIFSALEQRSAELLAKPPAVERGEVVAAKLAQLE